MIAEIMAKTDITNITVLFVNKRLPLSKNTMLSAKRLFRKWAKIGTTILSVLTYKMAMHIAKMNAEVMLPKVCMEANSNEVTNMESVKGITNLNLFNKTPLNINSSEIGDTITVAMKLPTAIKELLKPDELKLIRLFEMGEKFKIMSDKYKNP